MAIAAEGHSCRNRKPCSHIFDLAVPFQANNFADAESRKAGPRREFKCIEQAVRSETHRDNRGEAGPRTRYSQPLQLGGGVEPGRRVRIPGGGEGQYLGGTEGDWKKAQVADEEVAVSRGD